MTAVDSHEAVERIRPDPGEGRPTRSAWRRHLWLVLFAIYCLGFGLVSFVRFVGFDQSMTTTIPPAQYQLLKWHVIFGSVAMCLAWLQVWPWLRTNHRRVHRRIGLVYFLAGVIPAGLLAIPVAILTGAGQPYRMALLTLGVLWLTTTFFGFRAALRGRYAIHRRWMLRNVALTTAIITARPITLANFLGLSSVSPKTYSMTADVTYNESLATGMWCAVILHQIIVEWILLRPGRRAKIDDQLPALGGVR